MQEEDHLNYSPQNIWSPDRSSIASSESEESFIGTVTSLDEASYWSSFSYYSHPESDGPGYWFTISVSLDGDAWRSFSAIRLALIYRHKANVFGNITVDDCFASSELRIPNSDRPLRQREVLSRQRRANTVREMILSQTSAEALPICLIAFEIVDISRQKDRMIGVKLIPQLHLCRHDHEFRVAYDRIYPCNATSHSAFALLESNHSFRLVRSRRYAKFERHSMHPPDCIQTYMLRVLPISQKRRRPFLDLPIFILRLIVTEALNLDGFLPKWRGDLFAFGMVCKSWSPVLDLFWSLYWRRSQQTLAVDISRLLRDQPQKAKYILCFSGLHYRDTYSDQVYNMPDRFKYLKFLETVPEDQYLRSCEAMLDILERAVSVAEVAIYPVDQSLVPRLVHGMSKLQNVWKCTVADDHVPTVREAMPRRRGLSIEDIQKFIANWSKLTTLEITGCKPVQPEVSSRNDSPTSKEAPSDLPLGDLADLRISQSGLSGPQLLRFIQSPRPCLRKLSLSSIEGFTNNDLLQFLLAIASTLVEIFVMCIEAEKTTPDEEYAIDAALPYMTSLQSLDVSGDVVSSLAIARKGPVYGPSTFQVFKSHRRGPSVDISYAPKVDWAEIVSALEVTSWRDVRVYNPDLPKGHKDWECIEEARRVASARGIDADLS